ncbi:hypothetical protein OF83DRAFT_1086226 [Amylostereum chailletii]|nr:hypothetical protein OF83DRAFT_1086226 [Amylostereum chailletii]
MKFGKQLQAEIIPGWSEYYLDYKFLKKIVSSLASNRPASEAAALALGVRPIGILNPYPPIHPSHHPLPVQIDEPPIISTSGQDDDRGPDFQAHKAAFFFKLERELEKINAFYLRKEAELKLRLETLLSKRRAAALRALPDGIDDTTQNYVEWKAVEEGFHLLERDLAKLQQFIEINATGFRKILKKWDKRSKSTTKELYLARQVDIQPVFNRQLISELSDTVAACLVDITDVSVGSAVEGEGEAVTDLILNRQISNEGSTQMSLFRDLESNLRKAVIALDEAAVRSLVVYSNTLGQQHSSNITRVLWKTVVDAPPALADLILATATTFDYSFVDDINGRTLLHEAAIAGALRLLDLCLANRVPPDTVDVYGRSALHYAAMHGHADVCRRLLEVEVSPYVRDMENYSPLVYATLRGSVECVRVLLVEGGVPAHPTTPDGDLIPLSLASLAGHLDVALLLLEHGAISVPNSNGEYPIHFAARQGHAEICQLLVQHKGWDLPDKYNEWTPLFHAARYGHHASVRVLLDAGCRTDILDELGNRALHYAAWYGHHDCVTLLVDASSRSQKEEPIGSPSEKSTGSSALKATESDIDFIPSLSLPPPMMPHRVYGHNYLDKQCLVQVTIGAATSKYSSLPDQPPSAVRLHPRLMGSATAAACLLSSPLLKLVMTSSPATTSAPHSISLPLPEGANVLTFQTPMLEQLSLEFSLYPNFGTKTIGRAVALPSLLNTPGHAGSFTLPILDHRLHVIGEVTRDLHPVVCADWTLPVDEFDLGVADVTLAQFEALAARAGRGWPPAHGAPPATSPERATALSRSLVSLESLIKILPASTWLCLELAYAGPGARARCTVRAPPPVDAYVDAILRAVYHASAALDGHLGRRKIIFTSFAPDVCAAVNWKQPNYPVFFASHCGRPSRRPPSVTASDASAPRDPRLGSLSAAVEFAKANNLLGVFVDAELLVTVPSLVRAVRDAGLLIGTYGAKESVAGLTGGGGGAGAGAGAGAGVEAEAVDAAFRDGVLFYHDPAARAWT